MILNALTFIKLIQIAGVLESLMTFNSLTFLCNVAFSSLRVYAIWNRSWIWATVVFILAFTAPVGTNLVGKVTGLANRDIDWASVYSRNSTLRLLWTNNGLQQLYTNILF